MNLKEKVYAMSYVIKKKNHIKISSNLYAKPSHDVCDDDCFNKNKKSD